jgi:hypothetical protein
MVLTAAQLAELMPDATELESDEPEMESSSKNPNSKSDKF